MIRSIVRSFALAVAATLVAAAGLSQVQPGDQSRWSLDFRAGMEQSSAHPIEIHMNADWISTIVAVRPGQYDAELQVANVQFTGDSVKSAPASSVANLQARLSRPFWATFRSDGGLLSMHFFRDEAPSDRNLLQMIAAELQIVRPASGSTSWTAQERDGAGEYSALYLMPAPDRILKRKLKYIYTDGVAGARAGAVRVSIDRSDITFLLAPNGAVEGIDGTNRVRMDLSSAQSGQLAAVTEFHAGNLRSGRAPELIGSLDRELPNVIDSVVATQKSDAGVIRAEADEALLKGDTTEAILATTFAKDARDSAADRLTALFRRRPEAASAAVDLLVKGGAKRIVTNALGAAGSLSAVAALSELAHNSNLDEKLRVDAVLAFVQMQHPIVEAMRVVEDLMNDPNANIRSAARMMSGALSRAGRLEHMAEADAMDASLITLYKRSQDTNEKTQLLSALGNSAGPSVVPVIEEALHDSTAAIRAAATRALRLAPGPEVDRILATVITSDSDGAVRAAAIFATRFRRPLSATLAHALLSAASADDAKYVRSDAIAVLGQNSTASPKIPETLKQIAEQDADAGVRRQASEELQSLTAAASARP
jgi:HEAT repeat protein